MYKKIRENYGSRDRGFHLACADSTHENVLSFSQSSPGFSGAQSCRPEGILTSRSAHPLTHMATKAAQIPSTPSTKSAYEEYVNPQWVSLLNLLGLNEEYERCRGSELYTRDGRRILDFLSGYCVHNPGHNHPYIVEALKDELDKVGPAMLQSHVPELAGALAERLCELAGGGLRKVYFGSSGSEGVEAAINSCSS